MTFTDVIFQRIQIKSSNKKHRERDQPSEHPVSNGTLRRIHVSLLDLINGYRLATSRDGKSADQQQISASSNSSMTKPSDLERAVAKKTVTFASVFDFLENEKPVEEPQTFELTPTDDQTRASEGDLVTVISNRYADDEGITNVPDNAEPYPFRSELQLFPAHDDAQSSVKSHRSARSSRRTRAQHFICRRRPKKLRHPIKINDPIQTMNRSRSAPDMLFRSASILPSTAPVQHRSLKNIRRWIKLSPIGRLVRSFGKQSAPPLNESSTKKLSSTHRSKVRRKPSDLIY